MKAVHLYTKIKPRELHISTFQPQVLPSCLISLLVQNMKLVLGIVFTFTQLISLLLSTDWTFA